MLYTTTTYEQRYRIGVLNGVPMGVPAALGAVFGVPRQRWNNTTGTASNQQVAVFPTGGPLAKAAPLLPSRLGNPPAPEGMFHKAFELGVHG